MISDWIVPVLLLALLLTAAWKRLPTMELFLRGARQGMETAIQVLPSLAAMLCAIELTRCSGLLSLLCRLCGPVFSLLGLPEELGPLVLARPLSGSAALAVTEGLLERFGPDGRIGRLACVVMGSSETIFYTMCVYFSQARDRRTGYAVGCSLAGMLAGVWLAGRLISG